MNRIGLKLGHRCLLVRLQEAFVVRHEQLNQVNGKPPQVRATTTKKITVFISIDSILHFLLSQSHSFSPFYPGKTRNYLQTFRTRLISCTTTSDLTLRAVKTRLDIFQEVLTDSFFFFFPGFPSLRTAPQQPYVAHAHCPHHLQEARRSVLAIRSSLAPQTTCSVFIPISCITLSSQSDFRNHPSSRLPASHARCSPP